MRIAYLGPPGTHSHEALLSTWVGGDDSAELVPVTTVQAAILAVEAGSVDRAWVPWENSLEGSVTATVDTVALGTIHVRMVGEAIHPVHHQLVVVGDAPREAVTRVLSHPQALGQCRQTLRRLLPDATEIATSSTAEAVRLVAEHRREHPDDAPWAALGTGVAAQLHGGRVLAQDAEDAAGNETRFVLLARSAHPEDGAAVVASPAEPGEVHRTVVVWWGHAVRTPGWLVRCLSELSRRDVNLTRIESRPLRQGGFGEYLFLAELEGSAAEPRIRLALEALAEHADRVRLLGSFPAATAG